MPRQKRQRFSADLRVMVWMMSYLGSSGPGSESKPSFSSIAAQRAAVLSAWAVVCGAMKRP